jgi:Membrane domain of glycerophosphoryl diester phosphodiesterase
MTQTSFAATDAANGRLRVGRVIGRSASMLRGHLPSFFFVGLIASSPNLVLASLPTIEIADSDAVNRWLETVFDTALTSVFAIFGQAVIIHLALQDMRRSPVRLIESLNVGLQRFWPLIGLAFADLVAAMGYYLLLVPSLVLYTIWFVALPACIVEQRGSWTSLRRSLELTKGHRWKVLGLVVLLLIVPALASRLVGSWLSADADPLAWAKGELMWELMWGPIVRAIGELMWGGIWTAFYAAVLIVTYRDLRMAKEGTDIEQIAVVFD